MAKKLTNLRVHALPVPERGSAVTRDTEVRGLLVRVYPSGMKTFFLSYSKKRKNKRNTERRIKLDTYSEVYKVARAREEAQEFKIRLRSGWDPKREKAEKEKAEKEKTEKERAEQEAEQVETVGTLCENYLEKHARRRKRPKSCEEDERIIRLFVKPELGEKKVVDVTKADLRALHGAVTDGIEREVKIRGKVEVKRFGGPVRANRVLGVLSMMFSFAVEEEIRADNPAIGLRLRNAEAPRLRYLKQDEMARLVKALRGHPSRTIARALLFLLLTGARKGEVLNATWGQFDLDNAVWTKPSAYTKQRKEHRVPLNEPALELLRELRTEADEARDTRKVTAIGKGQRYVFPGRYPGRPLNWPDGVWRSVCEEAGIEDCRMHDLRHSFASVLANNGVDIRILGKLLGHNQIASTMRYSHLYDEELRRGVEVMGRVFREASGTKAAELVPITRSEIHSERFAIGRHVVSACVTFAVLFLVLVLVSMFEFTLLEGVKEFIAPLSDSGHVGAAYDVKRS